MCDTIKVHNIDLSRNKISEIIELVLSSLQMCGAKYRIYLSKPYATTVITIHEITERIKSTILFEVNDN